MNTSQMKFAVSHQQPKQNEEQKPLTPPKQLCAFQPSRQVVADQSLPSEHVQIVSFSNKSGRTIDESNQSVAQELKTNESVAIQSYAL